MSGFLNSLHERHQQHRDHREERHEARHEHHGRGGRDDEFDNYDPNRGRRHQDLDAQSYPSHGQGEGRGPGQGQGRPMGGYAPPSGPPPGARGAPGFGSLGGLDRGDFASDAEIDRMVASGEFSERPGQAGRGYDAYGGAGGERGRYDAPAGPPPGGRVSESGRYDAPSGPPPGQGYGERTNEYGRYDAPSGPPPGRGHQGQQPHQGYGSSGTGYGGGSDGHSQYGSQQQQGRAQYDTPQALRTGPGKGQGNAPSGGFTASRDGDEQYGAGYGGAPNEPPRRGEAAGYYNQGSSGQGDRYAHLAGIAQEHGDDDPEVYRQATQGLHDRIQTQGQSRRKGGEDDDFESHVNAHRKAYGDDDHGPMDADAIGAAAAMEAIKQTAAGAPAGGFQASKASGGSSSKPGRATRDEEEDEEEEEEETTTARAGGSGGMQDKLMALAMSQAGKLFDKKNAGSSGGDKTQDKAQAMQSAAATAMQLLAKGKLDSGDMSQVMSLAMKLL